MENYYLELSTLIQTINENFWLIFLILAFLFSKKGRISGLLLIMMQILCGFNIYIFAAIMVFEIFSLYSKSE